MQEKLVAFSAITIKDTAEMLVKKFLDTENVEVIPLEQVIEEEILEYLKSPESVSYNDIYEKLMKLYEIAEEKPSPNPKAVDISRKVSLMDIKKFMEETFPAIETLRERLEILRQERDRKLKDLEIVQKLHSIDVKLEDMRESVLFRYRFGTIGNDYVQRLKDSVKNEDALILEIEVGEENTWLLIVHRLDLNMEGVLSTAGFVEYTLSENYSGTPQEICSYLEDELKVLEMEIAILQSSVKKEFFKNRRFIEKYFDYMYVLKNVQELFQKAGTTENFFVISGWTTRSTLEELEKFASFDLGIIFLRCQPKEKPPTLLRNKGFFKHFEYITRMFGLPSSDEIDPTPLTAIMFLMFFGMMFGDIGHGLALALFGFGLYRRFKNDLLYIIGSAGISSSVFGMFYGSIFGYDALPPLWKRPMENIDYFLSFSIYVGIFVVTLAMVLNIINKLKNRERFEIFLDYNGILGILIYWTAVVSILIFFKEGTFPKAGFVLIGVLVGILYVHSFLSTQAPLSERLVQAFFEVFEVLISYFSNTLSFVRLGAFALNHAGLFLAFYTMAQMTKSSIAKFTVLLLGNLIILGLEGLVVFIQTMRLEFYEFFTRFFKDSGKEFNPERYKL
ncbi:MULTISPECIES: V-type ATP synthase subunit I [Thermotoga]|nr:MULTISPECIES: V-type ATPase 116kDa subunit family protein [Thermotoga]AJG41007.1 ATPase [Thermotoga sp. RQ7]KFZ21901.1 Putative A-ATPase I-subunit [Thermotoga neapolitana LA10]HBF11627.1 ATPase [Thermotoga neapolitana]